ncbi:hypothetical protein [Streptomyces sparsogenes]|uniref:Uncharacterized protein n=1 Tax=Streptomyces sparsogenes DSM 40356 TaxID=1331668 RepID=A0A1R1SPX9_9ACTN|nr:hypothetical protein [Streptomyces sparsogenes]OMI40277.1 hypothetical protein SPAR_06865 [Streptomyces sparsogenes DSM 40356]
MSVDLEKLGTAVSDWKTMVGELDTLRTSVYSGLVQKSDAARWQGVNAGVTKEFVRSTAKEFLDLHAEAQSIYNVLQDAHTELTGIQKRAKALTEEARRGNPSMEPPDPGLVASDGGDGTVKVQMADMCTTKDTPQRTLDLMKWYADTLTGLVSHASEIDAAVTQALRKSHGGDPNNAGHTTYTTRRGTTSACHTAGLARQGRERQAAGRVAEAVGVAEPEARATLRQGHKDDLLAAGLLSPTVKRAAPDVGSWPHGVESPGAAERRTRQKMNLLAEGADWRGMSDASCHMAHYLGNSGDPVKLPVDKMLWDDEGFRNHIDQSIRQNQDEWRKQALEEFKHYDLGASVPNNEPLPGPDEPGREGGRTDPGRERQRANGR